MMNKMYEYLQKKLKNIGFISFLFFLQNVDGFVLAQESSKLCENFSTRQLKYIGMPIGGIYTGQIYRVVMDNYGTGIFSISNALNQVVPAINST
jgi:hypothetical protein